MSFTATFTISHREPVICRNHQITRRPNAMSVGLVGVFIDKLILHSDGCGSKVNMSSQSRNLSDACELILYFDRRLSPVVSDFGVLLPIPPKREFQQRRLFFSSHPTFKHNCRHKFFRSAFSKGPLSRVWNISVSIENVFWFLLGWKAYVQRGYLTRCHKTNPPNDHRSTIPVPYSKHDRRPLLAVLNCIESRVCVTKLKVSLFLCRGRLPYQAANCCGGRECRCPAAERPDPCDETVLCFAAECLLTNRISNNYDETNDRYDRRTQPSCYVIWNLKTHDVPCLPHLVLNITEHGRVNDD